MKKLTLLSVIAIAILLVLGLSIAVLAQGPAEVPPPYKGQKNPFPWDNTNAREAGMKVYQQSCMGCHGAKGNGVPTSDFSAKDYPQKLEQTPDYYFWLLSEGKLSGGMPPYKTSLAEEQKWQVLTYMWSLSQAAPAPTTPAPTKPALEGVSLSLITSRPGQAGQPITITATAKDKGQPLANIKITFFEKLTFFASGLMEIEDALTNSQGIAEVKYAPREEGEVEIIARYETVEASTKITLAPTDKVFYHTEAGIQLPSGGPEIFIGPESAHELGKMGEAPFIALRLPGGLFSWLLIVVFGILLIYGAYFTVMYQVFRIPGEGELSEVNTRLVPLFGLLIIAALGLILALKVVVGPFSHFNLF